MKAGKKQIRHKNRNTVGKTHPTCRPNNYVFYETLLNTTSAGSVTVLSALRVIHLVLNKILPGKCCDFPILQKLQLRHKAK